MRWAKYEHNGKESYGIVEGETIEEVNGIPWENPKKTGNTVSVNDIKWLPPVIPPTFYAAGLNYAEHVIKTAKRIGKEPNIPEKPDIGYRAVNALIGHEENIVIPKDAGELMHYEAEIVAIIGKKTKHISKEDALSCVFGYTIGNDVSERDWQKGDRTLWRGKNTDTFKPMGPWIETDVGDLDKLTTTVKVNSETTIEFPTNNMIFDIPTYISAMSKYVTIYPGDMIWMGTEGASPNMKPGDVCEIEITNIGMLRNTFVLEE